MGIACRHPLRRSSQSAKYWPNATASGFATARSSPAWYRATTWAKAALAAFWLGPPRLWVRRDFRSTPHRFTLRLIGDVSSGGERSSDDGRDNITRPERRASSQVRLTERGRGDGIALWASHPSCVLHESPRELGLFFNAGSAAE